MNRQFGALGGLAMVLIVINHAIELGLDLPQRLGFPPVSQPIGNFLLALQALGVVAVPIFLFISGSFLAYAAQGDPPRLTTKFLLASLRNILIPYVIWSVIFFILIFFHWSESYSPLQYLKHLATGYPFHFIPLLVFFYVLSPLLGVPAKRFPLLFIAAIAIYQFVLIVTLNPNIFGFKLPGWMSILEIPALKQTMSEWALYFPLGMVYGLHVRGILPVLKKFAWLSGSLTVVLFILALLTGFGVIVLPAARYLLMLTFVLLIPAIRREQIPFVKLFERIGKLTYGLYLTHLICLDLFVFALQLLFIQSLGWRLLLLPAMILFGIAIPVWVMETLSRSRMRKYYRFLFG